MTLLQNIIIGQNDENANLRAWIEVIAIVLSPVITIILWQLNKKEQKWRTKMNIAARMPVILNKYGAIFMEIERSELNFQMNSYSYLYYDAIDDDISRTEREKYDRLISQNVETGNKLKEDFLAIASELTESYNKFRICTTNKESKELGIKLRDLDKIKGRKFTNEFNNMRIDEANAHRDNIMKKIIDEYTVNGIGKTVNEINQLIIADFNNEKQNAFQKAYRCYCRKNDNK